MAEQPYDPEADEAVRLAVQAHSHKGDIGVQAVIALLRRRYEAEKEMLVALNPFARQPPGALTYHQGQANAIFRLLDDIENGPDEMRATQSQQPHPE